MAHIGQTLTFSVLFTDEDSIAADPTVVTFFLREGIDGTELEWTFNAVPIEGTHYPTGMNPIEKDSTGNYSLPFVSRKAERHTGFWRGTGAVNQTSQVTVFVRHSDIEAVDGV